MRTKTEVLQELETMLRDVLAAKAAGGTNGRIARAHGYVDGYMRALLDLAIVEKGELLRLVQAVRERASGPAMRTLGEVTPEPATSDSVHAA